MATNLPLAPDLNERALKVRGENTKKVRITHAFEEFVIRRNRKRLVELMHRLEWNDSFDYKAERSRG